MILPIQYQPITPFLSLPYYAQKYANELSNELNVDENMVACAMISSVTVAGLGKIECHINSNYIIPGVLWIVVGADSGLGKTPTFSRVQGVLRNIFNEQLCFSPEKEQEIATKRGLLQQRINHLMKKGKKLSHENFQHIEDEIDSCKKKLNEHTIPISPIVDRISLYSYISEISKRKGVMAAIGAEGSILADFHTVSQQMLQPLLKSWSLEEVSYVSKISGAISVTNPRLHIGIAWQTSEIKKILTNENYQSMGIAARFLYYQASKKFIIQNDNYRVSHEAENWWHNTLLRQYNYSSTINTNNENHLSLSPDALQILNAYKNNTYFTIDNSGSNFIGKFDQHAVRLAIALHCLEFDISSNKTISMETLTKACLLTQYFFNNIQRVVLFSKNSKNHTIAFEICQIFKDRQARLNNYVVIISTKELVMRTRETIKAVEQAMYWLSTRYNFQPTFINVDKLKPIAAWGLSQNIDHINAVESLL
jgi:hypothetical protein